MILKEVMTSSVRSISPDATLHEAAREMQQGNVGMLAVLKGGELVGVLTDRDITIRATAVGLNPDETPVERVMTHKAVTVNQDEDLDHVLDLMEHEEIGRVVVCDREGRPVGVFSAGDATLVTAQNKHYEALLRTLSERTHKAHPLANA